ncbi:hypothetical protein [Pseudomonas syringae]|uniref:hypothetical protein n=1 Tax=Pseudomonas syringae TaxID=317 RepID=UPI000A21BF12|nr:hypothetical protein [Pseudomonas syringae]MBL3606636.1 hypothetical protein [Pseudomonas syringae pv. actinidiae]OSR78030.1 hypothetical protein BV327_01159 [Pseudomonas syringae pv. actinidiae]OSS32666.1 hypothetical protein BV337_00501 [Pseudomonas syringae pv. actinidiae]
MTYKSNSINNSKLSSSDADIARQLIERARLSRPRSDINYEASWLLEGSLGDAIWRTTNARKESLNNDRWYNTRDIIFDWMLPDGTSLIDTPNNHMLLSLQKWAFLLRSGHLEVSVGPQAWQLAVGWAKNLTSWAVLNEVELRPKEFWLNRIDAEHSRRLLQDLSKGNWAEALKFIPRLYTMLHQKAFGIEKEVIIPNNFFSIDEKYKIPIIEVLKATDNYGSKIDRRGNSQISREYLAKELGTSPTSFTDLKVRAFLRQFEPELAHNTLLLNIKDDTLFPSQNTPLLEDCVREGATSESLNKHKTNFTYLTLGRSYLPDVVPRVLHDEVQEIQNECIVNCRRSKHHNLVPLSVGLNILNESMKWIEVYGESIIHVACEFLPIAINIKNDNLGEGNCSEQLQLALTTSLQNAPLIKLNDQNTVSLNEIFDIHYSTTKKTKFIKPSFQVLLQSLIGACAIGIAFLKPSRDEEIESLERDCIYIKHFLGEGAWIRMRLGKSGQLGLNTEIDRPIPAITVKGICLLQSLGDTLTYVYSDNTKMSTRLFYIPFGRGIEKPKAKFLGTRINYCMDLLCDWAGGSVDTHGRRWYVRIHEMRKLFLLMFFWYSKGHYFDTARWIAGHIDERHTEAYLEANVPGEEISEIVAQVVDEKLIALERGKINAEENVGLVALYNAVCKNFRVNSIESIEEKHYFGYIKGLLENGKFDVQPIAFFGGEQVSNNEATPIAVRYEEFYDARFKIS